MLFDPGAAPARSHPHVAGPPAAHAHVAGPPAAHTGGFGEPTCQTCHIGLPLNAPGSSLDVVGIDGAYHPGRTYPITVRIEGFDMWAAGFQAAIRWDGGARSGTSAGTLRATGERVAVVSGADGRVQYVQHVGAAQVEDGVAEWRFEWTAPDASGRLVVHVAANSGNGDNSPLDDLIYTLAQPLVSVGRETAMAEAGRPPSMPGTGVR